MDKQMNDKCKLGFTGKCFKPEQVILTGFNPT
jgi:hypothetical protein